MIKIYDRTKHGIKDVENVKSIVKKFCDVISTSKHFESYNTTIHDDTLKVIINKVWINEIHNDYYFHVIVEDHLTEIEVIREV